MYVYLFLEQNTDIETTQIPKRIWASKEDVVYIVDYYATLKKDKIMQLLLFG